MEGREETVGEEKGEEKREGREETVGEEKREGRPRGEMGSALLNHKELYHRPKKEIRYILLQKSTSFIAVNDLL